MPRADTTERPRRGKACHREAKKGRGGVEERCFKKGGRRKKARGMDQVKTGGCMGCRGGDALGDKELFSVIKRFFLAKERDLGKRWGAQW